MAALGAGGAVAVMAIVTTHAAIRLDLAYLSKNEVVDRLLMGSRDVGTSATRARQAAGTGKDIPHQLFTLRLPGDVRLARIRRRVICDNF